MLFKKHGDLELSALGLGCMRLPKCGEKDSDIDERTTAEMVAYALENGINYFDTAWMYHGHNSENVMGRILGKYPRETFHLATKFPAFSADVFEKAPEVFQTQLDKCQVSYFDFYLLHNVTDHNIDMLLDEKYGVMQYLVDEKRSGRIRYLGFSTHGSLAVIRRFLDAWGHELSFCQIQLNYLDWPLQNAKAKVDLLNEYGVPVWVMEPVRGGRLVELPQDAKEKLQALRPGVSAPEWAFRFLQSIPGVTVVLSGMSNMDQLRENIRTFSELKPLSQAEWDALMEISGEMIAANAVPCTACSYCTEHCPSGLDIPGLIKRYNEKQPVDCVPGPADCVGCRSCESVCPQGIRISEIMAKMSD